MILITFNGSQIEIPYDRSSLIVQETIDSTFDSGYFKSVPLTTLGALDYTKRIPRDLDVEITYEGETYYLKTGETKCEKVSYGTDKYIHFVNLISRTESLTKLPLENMTVTQPKGDYGQYSRSVNKLNETKSTVDEISVPVWNVVDNTTVSMLNITNSNTSIYDDMEILEVNTFKVAVELVVWVKTSIDLNTLSTYIKYNGDVVYTDTYTPTRPTLFGNPIRSTKTYTFEYTPTALGTFTIEFFAQGSSIIYLEDVSFMLTSVEVVDQPIRTNAQVIDKMLRNTEYVQDTETRARLNSTATENTYNEYTVYDATQFIASEDGALVKVGLPIQERIWSTISSGTADITANDINEKSPYDYELGTILQIGTKKYENIETEAMRTEIGFKYFDRPRTIDPVGETSRQYLAELDNYVSALELNTRNIVKPIRYSPFKGGWKSLRADGIGRITTDNIIFELEDNTDRIISVKVKGFACSSAAYTILATDEIDITERVVEKTQYDSFDSESDYSLVGKAKFLKNNTLYYVKGSNKILGMGYTGEHLSTLIGTANVVRSLYETILATLSNLYGELFTRNGTQSQDDPAYDGNLNGDLAILMQVEYANITTSRARIYKDDQSGFNRERIKYLNESASINESENIGNYGQLLVNRLGGTKLMVTGVCDHDELAKVGDKTSDGYIYTVINKQLGKRVTYTYTLVKDYNVISSYIGTKSAHRVEEISSDNTVDRTLRYTSKVIFTEEPETFSTRLLQSELVFSSLFSNTGGLTYGYLECNLSNGDTKKVHLSIDTDSKGKTIEIKFKLANNYSAGLKRYSITSGGDTVWMTANVPYTDYYGKVNDIFLMIYFDTLGTIDQDIYPEATTSDGDDAFVIIGDTIDKDAREVIGGLIEIPILTEDDSVRVYNGMARYNKLVEGSDRIRIAVLQYEPLRNARKIDLSRAYDVTSTLSGSSTIGVLTVGINSPVSGVGIAFYNVDTLDLCLVFMDAVTVGVNTFVKHYKIEENIYAENLIVGSFNINSILGLAIDFDYAVGPILAYNLDSTLALESALTYTRTKDIGHGIDGSMSLGITTSYEVGPILAFNLDSQFAMASSLEYTRTKDIGMALSAAMGLGISFDFGRDNQVSTSLNSGMGLIASLSYTIIYVQTSAPSIINKSVTDDKGWIGSNATYWNAQSTSNRTTLAYMPSADNYAIGFALRISDFDNPGVYTYFVCVKVGDKVRWQVTNNDASSATIYGKVGSASYQSLGTLAGGATSSTFTRDIATGGDNTIYVYSIATGEMQSSVTSL